MVDRGTETGLGLLICGRFVELDDALAERVLELKGDRPLAPLTIVVGSAAARTHVGDLLVRKLGAVANVNIATLSRLAGDLVAGARGAPPAVLAGLARERMLRRLIEAHQNHLEYFGPVVDRPHFAAALAATFADLREGCVAPDSDWAEAIAAAAGAALGAGSKKAGDLDRLYRAYCDKLAELGMIDGAGVQLEAAAAVRAAVSAAGSGGVASAGAQGASAAKTILYGIYDLNEAQKALIDAVIWGGADVFVPVPRHGQCGGATVRDAALALGLVEHRVEPAPEGADRDRVAAVWRDRDGSAGELLKLAGDGSLRVISVSDERAEAREAVREVLTAAAERDVSLRDCAVVVPHGEYVKRVAAVLTAAGLPIACRLPDKSDGPRILLRLADCLAPPAGKPFARRAVIDLFAAAPLRRNQTGAVEMALWLDEARQASVVAGLDQWTERVGRRRSGLAKRVAELEERPVDDVIDDDDQAADRLETLRTRLAAISGLYEATRVLESACRDLPTLRASWATWAEKLEAVVDKLFESPANEAARDAAGRLRALAVVDEEVDAIEVAAVLRELLASGSEQRGRIGRDGVAVVTPLELRGLSFHTVVFTGLAEGGFPTRGRPDPILGDAQRRQIDADRGRPRGGPAVHLPVVEDRAGEALLLFAFACEAARERLVLIAPRTEAESGRPRITSRLLMALASFGAGKPVGQDEFLKGTGLTPVWQHVSGSPAYDAKDAVWVDAREHDTQALLHLGGGGGGGAARTYFSAALADAGAAQRRLDAWSAAGSAKPGVWDGLLADGGCAALAELPPARRPLAGELSPTRLERYIACPFAFLLRDVLGLEAPEEPGDSLEIDNREFGTLVHRILQQTYRQVIDDELTRDDALTAVTTAWEACCAEAESHGVTGAKLSWGVRRTMLLEDLIETVGRDSVFAAGSRPVDVEWAFGEEHHRPVALDLGSGRQVSFRGRIDRFDVTPSGARVIDYKTGAGGTQEKLIKDGLSVQLPVYQLAVRAAGEVGAGGSGGASSFAEIECLYRLVTRRGGFADHSLRSDELAAVARLRDIVAGTVDLVAAGKFPRTTAGRCDDCDVSYACGISDWARARKREHEELADVVRLQRPAPKEDVDGD
jgi:RecB family exonuclease/inactivated superfamily I helicase